MPAANTPAKRAFNGKSKERIGTDAPKKKSSNLLAERQP